MGTACAREERKKKQDEILPWHSYVSQVAVFGADDGKVPAGKI